MVPRILKGRIDAALKRKKSVLLLGARQVGKTTLLSTFKSRLQINLAETATRHRYERTRGLLQQEIDAMGGCPLVLIDEIQKVPEVLDDIQVLIDKKKARFLLTGSSARKLKRGSHINLLPGRVVSLRLDALSIEELGTRSLEQMLLDGQLPGVLLESSADARDEDLRSYVETYLEEEIRQEALVRNIGDFSRFLEYAALESGRIVNFSNLSNELGPSVPTITNYFEILFDCLIADRIDPITKSRTRKKLSHSPKILFFDLGVRRAAAREGRALGRIRLGELFEHFVGNEILRWIRTHRSEWRLRYWRVPQGPEVDWVIDCGDTLIPVEVKLGSSIGSGETKHLQTFLREYSTAKWGYVVCETPRPLKISEKIHAISWKDLPKALEKMGV